MLTRVAALTLNTYRESVRARVLVGIFALAAASAAYAIVVASLSLHNEVRVVADLGAAAMSLYAVLVAIVLGSTSLYRELQHKTVFPILSRPVRRWEYLLGKYFGTLLTVAVFLAVDSALVFAALAVEAGQAPSKLALTAGAMLLGLVAILVRSEQRTFVSIPWCFALALAMWLMAAPAFEDRQLVAASALLAFFEVTIVAAVATLFSSFSSPFLTGTFTAMIFVIGRSADTLAHLPKRMLGSGLAQGGAALARVVPNLDAYVPARPLLLGQTSHSAWGYVATAALQASCYATVLFVVAAIVFRRRDFS